jgi:hypothetical protein
MIPVLHLNPAVASPAPIDAVTVLRHQPLQPHQAGMAKQLRADLALLERREMDAVDAAGQQLLQVGLTHRQRQSPDIVAAADHDVEGIELDLGIVLA